MKSLPIILLLSAISACSNKAIYDNLLMYQRDECRKQPPSAYDECMERTKITYQEYQRKRRELVQE